METELKTTEPLLNESEMAILSPVWKAIGNITLILERLDAAQSLQLKMIKAIDHKLAGSPRGHEE